MPTKNVVLSDQQSVLVEQWVSSGRFQNASEALRAGLRLLQREEAEFADLQQRLSISIEQAQNEQFAAGNGDDVINRVFAKALAQQS